MPTWRLRCSALSGKWAASHDSVARLARWMPFSGSSLADRPSFPSSHPRCWLKRGSGSAAKGRSRGGWTRAACRVTSSPAQSRGLAKSAVQALLSLPRPPSPANVLCEEPAMTSSIAPPPVVCPWQYLHVAAGSHDGKSSSGFANGQSTGAATGRAARVLEQNSCGRPGRARPGASTPEARSAEHSALGIAAARQLAALVGNVPVVATQHEEGRTRAPATQRSAVFRERIPARTPHRPLSGIPLPSTRQQKHTYQECRRQRTTTGRTPPHIEPQAPRQQTLWPCCLHMNGQ